MPATVQIPSEFRAKDKFSHVVKKMTMGVSRFSKTGVKYMRRFDSHVTRSFNKIKRMAGPLGTFLGGAALLGALSGAVQITADYEAANSNLAAVLGVNVEQTEALQKSSRRLGATTAFTAGEVAGLQTEYAKLGFTETEILKATDSTLALAAATRTDLGQAAAQVGATIRAFNYDASEAARISDVFASSTSKSALNMEFLNTAMSIVAPVASKFGFSVEEVTSLLGSLADSGFDASSAATATRNILLNLADSNGKLAKSLGGPVRDLPSLVAGLKKLDASGVDLAKMLELTDKRSVAAFATFVSGTDKTLDLNQALIKAGGTAEGMANKQLDNLKGKTTILKSAYEGFILSLEDGSGPYADTAKNILMVATEMLSMASGTAKASSELNDQEKKIRAYAIIGGDMIKMLGVLIGMYGAMKVAMVGYSIYQGIATAAAWLAVPANAALAATIWAVTWPILAIIAAIAAVVAVIYYWNDITAWFGKQWQKFTDWISKTWNNVVKWFKDFDFKAFFKDIGQSILKFMLWPMKHLLTLASNLPGKIGKMATVALDKVKELTGEGEMKVSADDPLDSPETNNSKITQKTMQENMLSVDIRDKGDNVERASNEGPMDIPININKTQGAF